METTVKGSGFWVCVGVYIGLLSLTEEAVRLFESTSGEDSPILAQKADLHTYLYMYELRTKFKLGRPIRRIYRVLGGTYSGIYYKFRQGLIYI